MSTRTADYRDAIEHLPDGATLVVHDVSWDDYEHFLDDLSDRPRLRVSYDRGRLEIMTPLPEHETYGRFIDRMVSVYAELRDLTVESYGSATWKRRALARGVEPDACYYAVNAHRIIGKHHRIDLESDPPPDIVVEIDITNESLAKFGIYAALSVPEIWRYDGREMRFYELADGVYHEVLESRSMPGLKPATMAEALEQSRTHGQTASLRAFRQRCSQ
jgi:Uma2 family endonuclease